MLTEVDLQIGYRVRDEICFYLIYAVKSGVFTFDQAFDFQILQKFCLVFQEAMLTHLTY